MNAEDIASTYPQLYHMAEEGSWESIERHGLLSTRSLVDLFQVGEPDRSEILSKRRATSRTLTSPAYGSAVVRDQIPLSETRLRACLTDMTLEEWLDVLNSRVFFWLNTKHLETLLGARAYKDSAHDVICIDTAALLERHAGEVTLSPINSGATMYKAPDRGSRTFLPIAEYPYEERKRARGAQDAIVELAVDDGVRDILDVAVRVERRKAGGDQASILWERES
jgi:hypothetical protein